MYRSQSGDTEEIRGVGQEQRYITSTDTVTVAQRSIKFRKKKKVNKNIGRSIEHNTNNTYENGDRCVRIWKRREMRTHVYIRIRGPKFGTYSDGGFQDFLLLINILHIAGCREMKMQTGKEFRHIRRFMRKSTGIVTQVSIKFVEKEKENTKVVTDTELTKTNSAHNIGLFTVCVYTFDTQKRASYVYTCICTRAQYKYTCKHTRTSYIHKCKH